MPFAGINNKKKEKKGVACVCFFSFFVVCLRSFISNTIQISFLVLFSSLPYKSVDRQFVKQNKQFFSLFISSFEWFYHSSMCGNVALLQESDVFFFLYFPLVDVVYIRLL